MPKSRAAEDPAIVEERRSIIDRCIRRGWSPYDIAKMLATEEEYSHLIESLGYEKKEGELPGKLTHLVREKLIRKDIEAIRARFKREVSPQEAEGSLAEYVARLDHLYEEMFREYADAADHRDRIAALRAANEVAEAKARAMGVDLEPKVSAGLGKLAAAGGLMLTQLVHAANGALELPGHPKELPAQEEAIDGEYVEVEETTEEEEPRAAEM